jgi:hypothetical protein
LKTLITTETGTLFMAAVVSCNETDFSGFLQ